MSCPEKVICFEKKKNIASFVEDLEISKLLHFKNMKQHHDEKLLTRISSE